MKKIKVGSILLFAVVLFTTAATAQTVRKQKVPRRGEPGPLLHPLMAALDVDKDGTISQAEIETASAALKTLDKDEDGALTEGEIGPPEGRFGCPKQGRAELLEPDLPSRQRFDRQPTPKLDHPSIPKTDSEEKILSVLDDMHRNQRRGMMNVAVENGRLLRLLAETIGARHVVEIGTSNGYSAIWLCLALQSTGGKLTTYEIDPYRASLARKNFKRAGVEGMITLVEGDAHTEIENLKGPVDLVFIDADKEGYVDYLEKLLPRLRPGGLIVAHNMVRPAADHRYIEAITTNPDLDTIFLSTDAAGVGVTLKKTAAATE